jgi:NADH-quinone oxidoreductase subunit G
MNFNVKINGQDYQFDKDYTIIQACEIAGIEIPRFCYHERLEIAGNCRMCLVTVKGAPKPVASCATNIANNMEITTNDEKTKFAREGVMELLLINHPLDCPVCDQGGECDLQDQAMVYGKGSSEYHEEKRIVKEKELGPFIKTAMTRCILCMRCVRFMNDIAGVPELNAINRGEKSEIINAISGAINSELSGNIIDLCPVGALTNKPYSFKARPWELKKTNSIDIMDSLCSNIRIDSKGKEVLRILPRENDNLNEEWISDKTRFAFDGLKYNRIMNPYIKKNGKFSKISWKDAFQILKEKIFTSNPKKISVYTGKFTDCETIFALKKLCEKLNITNLSSNSTAKFFPNDKKAIFNTTVGKSGEADFYIIVGCDIRKISPVLNSRIRQNIVNNFFAVHTIGGNYDLTYKTNYLGDDLGILKNIANGKHSICDKLSQAKKPMIILDKELFSQSYELANFVLETTNKLIEKYNFINSEEEWNGINILHKYSGSINGLVFDFNKSNDNEEKLDLLFLFGEDDIDIPQSDFIVYVGHHGDKGAQHATLVLPSLAYTEKSSTYINCEGLTQQTNKAIDFPGDAKEDWKIIFELSKYLNISLGFENIENLRKAMRSEFNIKNKQFFNCNAIANKNEQYFKTTTPFDEDSLFVIEKKEFDFYQNDVISKNSKIMKSASMMKNQK